MSDIKKFEARNQWRREGEGKGGRARVALCRGRHLEGRKYGILKFGRFWRIGICIIPPNTPQYWDHTPTLNASRPHKSVCTPRNLHCWSDWSFACCKTVEDPYCLVTVSLAVAVRCFALFTWFQILHKIWKFCMKFGQLILRKIVKFVATLQMSNLKAKMHEIQFWLGLCPRPRLGSIQCSLGLLGGFKGPTSKGWK